MEAVELHPRIDRPLSKLQSEDGDGRGRIACCTWGAIGLGKRMRLGGSQLASGA
jgi:hypothetical protein